MSLKNFTIFIDDQSVVDLSVAQLTNKFSGSNIGPLDTLVIEEAKKCIADYSSTAVKIKNSGGSINSSRAFETSIGSFNIVLEYPKRSFFSKVTSTILGNS